MAQTIQIYRTNSNTPPATLLSGVLSAELGAQTKLWIGSGSGNRLLLSSDPADSGAASSAYLKLAGGTLTGPLLLAADPSATLGAATKQYVDSKTAAITAAAAATYLPLAGGNLTGPLTLAADPSAALGAATKQYVDAKPSGALVAPAPPAAPAGALWWDTIGGQLYLNYYDGTSTQWVTATSVPGLVYPITIDQGGTGAITAPQALINLGAAPLSVAAANIGRNLIHNGRFNIQQRGAGTFTAPAYTADRWRTITSGCTGTTALYPTSAPDETLQWQANNVFTGSATAGAFYFFTQSIEGVKRLGGTTVTISFWGSTGVGSLNLGVILSQVFGTGGSPSPTTFSAAVTVVLTPVWQRFTVTIAVPSASGKTLGTNGDDSTNLIFIMSQQGSTIGVQSGTIALAGVQLEVGGVATPLEKPDPRYDLANCQRFYTLGQIYWAGYQVAASTVVASTMLPVTMRATPTFTITTNASTNFGSPSIGGISGGVYAYGTSVSTGASGLNVIFNASADL